LDGGRRLAITPELASSHLDLLAEESSKFASERTSLKDSES
jgi:hypothetical protein